MGSIFAKHVSWSFQVEQKGTDDQKYVSVFVTLSGVTPAGKLSGRILHAKCLIETPVLECDVIYE